MAVVTEVARIGGGDGIAGGPVAATMPMRVFAADGDIHHLILGSGIDPWVISVVGGYLAPWAIVDFSRNALPLGMALSDFFTPTARAVTFVVATVLHFGYFSGPSLLVEPDMASHLIARTSVLAIPPVLILLWNRVVTPPAGADQG